MPITPLPNPPSRTDPINFAPRADAFLDALPQFATEANALEQAVVATTNIATSTSTISVSPGSKNITTQASKSFGVGQWLMISNTVDYSVALLGTVTSYNATSGDLVVDVVSVTPPGTNNSSWVITPSGPISLIAQVNYPSVSVLSGDTVNVLTSSYFRKVFSANSTLVFSGTPSTGKLYSFRLEMQNAGQYTVVFPASVRWAGGIRPVFSTSSRDVVEFSTVDGGTTWQAATVLLGV